MTGETCALGDHRVPPMVLRRTEHVGTQLEMVVTGPRAWKRTDRGRCYGGAAFSATSDVDRPIARHPPSTLERVMEAQKLAMAKTHANLLKKTLSKKSSPAVSVRSWKSSSRPSPGAQKKPGQRGGGPSFDVPGASGGQFTPVENRPVPRSLSGRSACSGNRLPASWRTWRYGRPARRLSLRVPLPNTSCPCLCPA